MYKRFEEDRKNQISILEKVVAEAESFTAKREKNFAYPRYEAKRPEKIPLMGWGLWRFLSIFKGNMRHTLL